jgi:DNA-binding NarL/FixJ family response regulator
MNALTAQEKRVISLLAQGLQHKEIADRLGVNTGTSKRHVANIHKKCGNPGNIVSMLRLFFVFVKRPGIGI